MMNKGILCHNPLVHEYQQIQYVKLVDQLVKKDYVSLKFKPAETQNFRKTNTQILP